MNRKELFKKVKAIELSTRKEASALFVGEYDSAFKGKGIEFDEVREYTPGDDVRLIDWNVTARTGKPHIKSFREERELKLYIAADMSASSSIWAGVRSKREYIAELCALLALVAQKNNDKVGLLLFTDQVEYHIPPKKGRQHINQIVRTLLDFQPQNKATDLNPALDVLIRWNKKRSVIFLISDFYTSGFNKALKQLALQNDLVALRFTSPIEKNLPPGALLPMVDPESGESFFWDGKKKGSHLDLGLWEEELKEAFKKAGCDYLSMECQEDYHHALSQFFKKRERLRHG